MFIHACLGCGTKLKISDKFEGEKIKCPRCGDLSLPLVNPNKSKPVYHCKPIVIPLPQPPRRNFKLPLTVDQLKGVALVIGIGLMLFLVICFIVSFPTTPASLKTEEEIHRDYIESKVKERERKEAEEFKRQLEELEIQWRLDEKRRGR